LSKVSIDVKRKIEIDQMRDITALDAWFDEQINNGYAVPGRNFNLGLQKIDRANLIGTFVLAKEAENLGAPIPPIIDAEGLTHEVTLEYFALILLGYNQYYAELSDKYAKQKRDILGA
jgi:hypothetical protein